MGRPDSIRIENQKRLIWVNCNNTGRNKMLKETKIPVKKLIGVRYALKRISSRDDVSNNALFHVENLLINPDQHIQKFKGGGSWDLYLMPEKGSLREFKPEQEFVGTVQIVVNSKTGETRFR